MEPLKIISNEIEKEWRCNLMAPFEEIIANTVLRK